jgi:hypothetical protein
MRTVSVAALSLRETQRIEVKTQFKCIKNNKTPKAMKNPPVASAEA